MVSNAISLNDIKFVGWRTFYFFKDKVIFAQKEPNGLKVRLRKIKEVASHHPRICVGVTMLHSLCVGKFSRLMGYLVEIVRFWGAFQNYTNVCHFWCNFRVFIIWCFRLWRSRSLFNLYLRSHWSQWYGVGSWWAFICCIMFW